MRRRADDARDSRSAPQRRCARGPRPPLGALALLGACASRPRKLARWSHRCSARARHALAVTARARAIATGERAPRSGRPEGLQGEKPGRVLTRACAARVRALSITNETARRRTNMLVAYTVTLDLIRLLRPIVEQIKMHDAHLAAPLRRAAPNTLAHLAEGQRRAAGNKRRAYETAHGEAREMLGCLDCALAWGYATDDAQARVTLDRLLGLCWGLTH